MIVECTLTIRDGLFPLRRILDVPTIDMCGELQKVECAAVLTVVTGKMLTLFLWVEEMFLVGDLTRDKSMLEGEGIEKKGSR